MVISLPENFNVYFRGNIPQSLIFPQNNPATRLYIRGLRKLCLNFRGPISYVLWEVVLYVFFC